MVRALIIYFITSMFRRPSVPVEKTVGGVATIPRAASTQLYAGPNNDGIFTQELEIPVPEVVQNNGSFYLHTFLVRTGDSPDPSGDNCPHRSDYTVHRIRQMNRFKKRKYSKTHNLLTGTTVATDEEVLVSWNVRQRVLLYKLKFY